MSSVSEDISQSVRLSETVQTAIQKGPAKLLTIKPLSDYVEDFLSFTHLHNLADRRFKMISLYIRTLRMCPHEISWPAQELSGQSGVGYSSRLE